MTVTELILSQVMLPLRVSFSALRVTIPPFDPVLPHLSALAVKRVPDVAVKSASFSSIIEFVFVM